jgi:hypothetical protein
MSNNILANYDQSELKIKKPLIRDTIFLGHANPEDNEFTLWLHSKLTNEGYKVECDLTFLTGGENDFWKSIQDLLENGTAKYILIHSKDAFLKQGVIAEWELANAIANEKHISDFRLVCKIDDVSFASRIGLNVMNQIRFDKSWGYGLKQLLAKLKKDNVPCGRKNQYSIDDWIKNWYSTNPFLKKKVEKYYSNWFAIPELPEEINFYEYDNNTQASLIANQIQEYPVIVHDKYLITFLKSVPTTSAEIDFEVTAKSKLIVPTRLYQDNHDTYDFPGHGDLKKFLVRLLKDALFKYFEKRNITFYEMSARQRCYYYKDGQLENNKVPYLYEGKLNRPKQLIGTYFQDKWHYGIRIQPILRPFLRIAIKGHLLFSKDGQSLWESKKELATARKSKGKGFFNADWRNLMLAFIHSLADKEGNILIPLSESFSANISNTPVVFTSRYGYDEPPSNARIVPLDFDYHAYDDEYDETEEEEIEEGEDEIIPDKEEI